jgi:hypothetical protein
LCHEGANRLLNRDTEEELITGIIVTVFEDYGPSVVYNASPLNESQAFNLAVKGMTTVGDSEEKEVYGPFPVPEVDDLRTLAFMFNIVSDSSSDSRIREFGRPIVVWIIFKTERKRNILHAAGLLQGYLAGLVDKIREEEDLTEDRLSQINQKLTDMLASIKIRVYGLMPSGEFLEFVDDSLIPASEVLLIADGSEKMLYILFHDPHVKPMNKRIAMQKAKDINKETWRFSLTERPVEDPREINKLLNFYKISQVRAIY